jgi:hypothetical protein
VILKILASSLRRRGGCKLKKIFHFTQTCSKPVSAASSCRREWLNPHGVAHKRGYHGDTEKKEDGLSIGGAVGRQDWRAPVL